MSRTPTPAALIDPAEHHKSKEEIGNRKKIEEELKTQSTLKCPNHLSEEAKKEWRRMIQLYKSMEAEILCDLDKQALIMYCEATAIYKKAQETWTESLEVISYNPKKQKLLDKCFSLMEKQTVIIKSLAEQLCLTPVGRAKMGMLSKREKKPNPLLELLQDD